MFHPSPNYESAVDQKLMEETAVAQRSPVNPCAWLRLSWLPKWRHPVANCPWSSAKMADHNKYRQFEYWSLNCQGVTFRPSHTMEDTCRGRRLQQIKIGHILSYIQPDQFHQLIGSNPKLFHFLGAGIIGTSPWTSVAGGGVLGVLGHDFRTDFLAISSPNGIWATHCFETNSPFVCDFIVWFKKNIPAAPCTIEKNRVLYCSHLRVFLLHNVPRSL